MRTESILFPYKNNSNKESGVVAYEIEERSILVKFRSGSKYCYTYKSAGADTIETMKSLAKKGKGLSTFISRHDPAYEHKSL